MYRYLEPKEKKRLEGAASSLVAFLKKHPAPDWIPAQLAGDVLKVSRSSLSRACSTRHRLYTPGVEFADWKSPLTGKLYRVVKVGDVKRLAGIR